MSGRGLKYLQAQSPDDKPTAAYAAKSLSRCRSGRAGEPAAARWIFAGTARHSAGQNIPIRKQVGSSGQRRTIPPTPRSRSLRSCVTLMRSSVAGSNPTGGSRTSVSFRVQLPALVARSQLAGIDAEALPVRTWSVSEDLSQVPAATPADVLGAPHPDPVLIVQPHTVVFALDQVWPPDSQINRRISAEEGGMAGGAPLRTFSVETYRLATESQLGPPPSQKEFAASDPLAPLVLAVDGRSLA